MRIHSPSFTQSFYLRQHHPLCSSLGASSVALSPHYSPEDMLLLPLPLCPLCPRRHPYPAPARGWLQGSGRRYVLSPYVPLTWAASWERTSGTPTFPYPPSPPPFIVIPQAPHIPTPTFTRTQGCPCRCYWRAQWGMKARLRKCHQEKPPTLTRHKKI